MHLPDTHAILQSIEIVKADIDLVVAGVGLAGKQHISAIRNAKGVRLCSIVDPDTSAQLYAQDLDTPWYPSLEDLFRENRPDGVILATPNEIHLQGGLECIKARCPVLVEKPIATSATEALVLVEQARKHNVPILVGHHRRHNPLVETARRLIEDGKLGQLRALSGICWLYKPDPYFEEAPWRKEIGAGPINVNLVHDIDLLRHLCGNIVTVQASSCPSVRKYNNEDVAAAIFRFDGGVIGTITVSDSIVAPWSWELTARENPKYPKTDQSCYLIGGSLGSLSLPDLTLWENQGQRGWWQPISATTFPHDNSNPLVNQIEHFCKVIRGVEPPMVSGEEGLKTLQVIEAIHCAVQSGQTITL